MFIHYDFKYLTPYIFYNNQCRQNSHLPFFCLFCQRLQNSHCLNKYITKMSLHCTTTGIASSINNKVMGHLEDRWATVKCFLMVVQRSSRCLYTLLLIELPTPVALHTMLYSGCSCEYPGIAYF